MHSKMKGFTFCVQGLSTTDKRLTCRGWHKPDAELRKNVYGPCFYNHIVQWSAYWKQQLIMRNNHIGCI